MLGCGTSTGVPVIGCRCATCSSSEPRNRRLRCGLRLDAGGGVVLVDTPPDLREQALRAGTDRVDAVLFTHAHADHLFGLDDLRVFGFRRRQPIRCYGSPETVSQVRRTFAYAFEDGPQGGGRPRIELVEVDGPFPVVGLEVVPVPLLHGELPILGFRIGAFAYLTDCSAIPEPSFELLSGVEVLVVDALRRRPHPTHFSIDEAIAAARRIGARSTWLTHLSHDVDYTTTVLPDGVALAYDGLVLEP